MDNPRLLTDSRKAQGFTSQAHLDAFYAHYDHAQACPVCSRVGGYMPLDDGLQPYLDACETGKALDWARCGFGSSGNQGDHEITEAEADGYSAEGESCK